MDAPAIDPRMSPLVPGLGVRAAGDPRRDARQQAFERAMQRRAAKAKTSVRALSAAYGESVATSAPLHVGAGLSRDDAGQLHVDVVV